MDKYRMDTYGSLDGMARHGTVFRYTVAVRETPEERVNKYASGVTVAGVTLGMAIGWYVSNKVLKGVNAIVLIPKPIRFTLNCIAALYAGAKVELPANDFGYKLGLSRLNSVLRKESGIESHV